MDELRIPRDAAPTCVLHPTPPPLTSSIIANASQLQAALWNAALQRLDSPACAHLLSALAEGTTA